MFCHAIKLKESILLFILCSSAPIRSTIYHNDKLTLVKMKEVNQAFCDLFV